MRSLFFIFVTTLTISSAHAASYSDQTTVYGSSVGAWIKVEGLAAKSLYEGLKGDGVEKDSGERGGSVFIKEGKGYVCTLAYQDEANPNEYEYDCDFSNLKEIEIF